MTGAAAVSKHGIFREGWIAYAINGACHGCLILDFRGYKANLSNTFIVRLIIFVRLLNLTFFLDGCVPALLLAVEEALALLLAFASLRGVTMSSAPVANPVRHFSVSGRLTIRADGLVVTLVLCLGLESVLFTVWAIVGRVAILATFSADSFGLLLCPSYKSFLSLVVGYVRIFGEAFKPRVQNSPYVFHGQ